MSVSHEGYLLLGRTSATRHALDKERSTSLTVPFLTLSGLLCEGSHFHPQPVVFVNGDRRSHVYGAL